MEVQIKGDQPTAFELRLYLVGAIIICVLFFSSFFVGSITPLILLQIRLSIVSLGIIYYLAVAFYQYTIRKKKHVANKNSQKEIIINFNGKLLGRE